MTDWFERGFREIEEHAAETSNGQPFREIGLSFGGATPGQAIEGLAEWAAANDQQGSPFRIEALRLVSSPGGIPEYRVVVTVDGLR
ncbi:hypothetical protein [Streptomyces sp. H27-H5]|uniref:hypothetical protein n=1 Tax=Streptomyces sp. H27-H5 TaxID=2996460 RepID=UPI00226DA335|nr:hypothetical protein [Streptomyces sp. H27-H5]MCY0960843.1 hypothetical protein [Streptomyces sp. H27-H5]